MFTRTLSLLLKSSLLLLSALAFSPVSHAHDHDASVFHAFRLEMDAGEDRENQAVSNWNLDGWIGGDDNKLWLKSVGSVVKHHTETSET